MAGIGQSTDPSGRRSRLDWSDLQLFFAIAETGSFTAAARALGLTQPTVSQRAKELEDRIGAQLFLRNPNGVSLTTSAEQMREHVRSMDRAAAIVGNIVADRDQREEGRVRICAPDGISAFWLAPRLGRFQMSHPNIKVVLDAAGLGYSQSIDADVEVSIQYEENTNPDNVVIPLGISHYLCFASPTYLDAYGTPASLADFAQHRGVRHVAQNGQREMWDPRVQALMTLWEGQVESNSSVAVLYAVQAGAGIGVMPSSIAVIAPDLVALEPAPLASIRKWLVYHRDVAQIARVRRVIDWIKEIYDPRANPWFRDEYISPRELRGLVSAGASAQPELFKPRTDQAIGRRA